jgi:1-acyl-sn-glycerol-3-phosphate acyltransferase
MSVLQALRTVLFYFLLAFSAFAWCLVCMVFAPFMPFRQRYRYVIQAWCGFAVRLARVVVGLRYEVSGQENIPQQPCVILAKHQSTWETFFLSAYFEPLSQVLKRELLYVPFFGWAMGRLDMIHIDRSRRADAWRRIAAQGRALFAQGVWVIMFPEGTRTPRGAQGKYQSGAARLAIEAGVPIVPIAIASARCWPRRSFVLRPGVIDVSIGAPIASAGARPAEVTRAVEPWIEAEMRRLDPEAYPRGASAKMAERVS